jgi:hypothetical protein
MEEFLVQLGVYRELSWRIGRYFQRIILSPEVEGERNMNGRGGIYRRVVWGLAMMKILGMDAGKRWHITMDDWVK